MEKLRYPIGWQSFPAIREEGRVYIDKTEIIYNLTDTSKYVFLARPRRFGKSLLLSTLKAYFEGRKELFEGFAISGLEKEWERHPVFLLQLARFDQGDERSLSSILEQQFREWEEEYGITDILPSFGVRLSVIIKTAYRKTGKRVVILVDEYDNPLINAGGDDEKLDINRSLLKSIYSNLKDMDEYIQFGMLTGVSRFSGMTIFSGLNNLEDITMDEAYSSICGFTEDEIRKYLWAGVENLAKRKRITDEQAMSLLKKEYDGYHFTQEGPDIYNPFSVLNALKKEKIESFWFKSGIPEFLANRLRESRISFTHIFDSRADDYELSATDTAFTSPVALLFQTGYLTIKGYDSESQTYRLGVPNREVERGLFMFLLGYYTGSPGSDSKRMLQEMAQDLKSGDPDSFLSRLQSFLGGIPYTVTGGKTEQFFEQTLYIILHVLGFHVHAESCTSRGRIDILVKTDRYIYVVELKLDGSPEEALRQIREKDYALQWRHDGREVYMVGINFSSKTRNIESWIVKKDTR